MIVQRKVLTADSVGVAEGLENIWVHLNEEIFCNSHGVVSVLDLFRYPVSEWIADNSSSHVTDPLLR